MEVVGRGSGERPGAAEFLHRQPRDEGEQWRWEQTGEDQRGETA